MGAVELFGEIPDPRWRNARHSLGEILFIALAASLCGAQSAVDMADFARSRLAFLKQVLKLEHGPPSHDTFSRVFRLLEPKAFAGVFHRFASGFASQAGVENVVAFDGKALRRCYERGKAFAPPLMVSAWAAQTRMTLAAQIAEGGNEVASVLEMLSLFDLKGAVVTADALHCHRAMAEAVVAANGDYALAVKANQPVLLREAKAVIEAAGSRRAISEEAAHDRHERREAMVAPAPYLGRTQDFAGLKAVAKVTSWREGEETTRWFLLSQVFEPARLLAIVREHWGIENRLHWVLDVVMEEDASRTRKDNTRKDNGPANLAILKRLALNVLRSNPDPTPIRRKIKRAGWEPDFLLSLLSNMR
jgi:predicted transposase YbfD/YdcC